MTSPTIPAPIVWTKRLDVPFVSQLGTRAALSNNDCGVSALLMLERFWFQQHGHYVPDVPDVDDLTRYTRLAQPNPPKGLAFNDLIRLAERTGFILRYVNGLTPEVLAGYLDKGTPVLALVNYATFNPKHGSFGHFAVVIGYSAEQFLCHDPYLGSESFVIARAQLDAAMSAVVGNAGSYQGAVLVE